MYGSCWYSNSFFFNTTTSLSSIKISTESAHFLKRSLFLVFFGLASGIETLTSLYQKLQKTVLFSAFKYMLYKSTCWFSSNKVFFWQVLSIDKGFKFLLSSERSVCSWLICNCQWLFCLSKSHSCQSGGIFAEPIGCNFNQHFLNRHGRITSQYRCASCLNSKVDGKFKGKCPMYYTFVPIYTYTKNELHSICNFTKWAWSLKSQKRQNLDWKALFLRNIAKLPEIEVSGNQ